MGRTANREGESSALDGVPALGTVAATVSMVGLLVPVRRGVDEPTLWAGTVFAVLAVGAFLAVRHDVFGRRNGSLLAAISSLATAVLAAVSVMLGTTGSVVVPLLEWSISFVFMAFLSGGAATGVALAVYGGVSLAGIGRRSSHFLEMVVLGFAGLFAIEIASLFVGLPVLVVVGELTMLQLQVVQYVSFAVGVGGVALGYLRFRELGLSYIDLERPSFLTVGWIVVGLILIFAANVSVSMLMTGVGIESAGHSTAEAVEENLDLLVVIIPAMVLVVGPAEELLYRNVVQKSLYDSFSRYGAVVVTSVVFSAVHISAYATAGASQVLASLAGVFALSIVLGILYERTEDLLVPSLVHGGYNALIFVPLLV